MAYVTKPFTHEYYYVPGHSKHQPIGITIHVLKENKRPIGYAPWPDSQPQVEGETNPKKRKKKRR